MEDNELLEKYQAIELKLHKYALTLTKHKEDAEDLVQDTFIKIWTKRHLYKEMKMFRAWCFTIMYNNFISNVSKNTLDTYSIDTETRFDEDLGHTPHAFMLDRALLDSHPVNYALTSLALDEVELLLTELTEVNRDIVKDRISGFSFKEIGSKHSISGDSAKLRYHNSISKLKTKIERQSNNGSN